jgi:zinc transporter ZupT
MKRSNVLSVVLFVLVYAVILSFGIECLFQCIGTIGTIHNIDSNVPEDRQSIVMYWLALIAGILSVAAFVAILIFNYNVSDKLGYHKYIWWIQFIAVAVITFFMIEPWERLFDFLREIL